MLTKQRSSRSSRLGLLIGLAGVMVGLVTGFLIGSSKPIYLGLALAAIPFLFCFFTKFEQTVLGLLVLRSSIDSITSIQLPSVFAISIDALTLLYVTVMLLVGRTVKTDRFWWFFACWVALQSLWVILLPLGGLGLGGGFLQDSVREWVRLFTWLMIYLLVMQLKEKLHPEKLISTLFLSLVVPITVALMQMFLPSLLPADLSPGGGDISGALVTSEGTRIRGTIGHPNGFATFLFLFIGLIWWKLGHSKRRWIWLILLSLVAFFYVSTKSLFSLMMLAVFVLVLIAPKLNLINLLGGILLFAIIVGLFASTEFGQQRLNSIANTPLLNPDIDISRAILLSNGDNNSFNWRISQWYLLLKAWQQYPILGYGLGLSIQAAGNGFLPHNDYIRVLVEEGIVGFVIFIAFLVAQGLRLVWLIQHTARGSKQRDLCLVLLAILLSLPVAMITENIWSHTMLFLYWYTISAVAGWNWNEQSPSKSPASIGPPMQFS
ncbi:MAG: O-antigen ligase family protein [Iphinoe sp. HA4291-MV1]|jgi:O-antigen ligase|nr:O-antigen ligase family protein [Iphinoe sp. HA4291-MV1]